MVEGEFGRASRFLKIIVGVYFDFFADIDYINRKCLFDFFQLGLGSGWRTTCKLCILEYRSIYDAHDSYVSY